MNSYDEVRYPNAPYAQTHPSRLFVMARLAGLEAPPVETCRVLEIGASEGENLIGMAMVMPSATFVGIDLALDPIELGWKTVAALNLKNVHLRQMNILDSDAELGEFDYIIAHGLYAWTPPVVRDKILACAHSHLHPQGVAYVSYNAQPAGHLRKMLRDMMLYRAAGETDSKRKMERAREVLRLIAIGRPKPDPLEAAVASHASELLLRSDNSLFHDEMGDIYEPVYFHEFAAHAGQHGLAYLGEANFTDGLPINISEEALAEIRRMSAGDRIAEQQYLDFARTRRFRQTLLCHAPNPLLEGTAEGCYATSAAREMEDGAFATPLGTEATTGQPVVVEYMRRLMGLWPLSERVSEGDAVLALKLAQTGLVELHGYAGAARKGGDRPATSVLARHQAARGDRTVTTLWHQNIAISDDGGRKLLLELDGSRDRDDVAREMECSRDMLDQGVAGLERLSLLTQ